MKNRNRKNTKSFSGLQNHSRQQPKQLIELQITALTHDGKGIGHNNGKTVFVQGALPHEQVRVKIIQQKKRFDEAVLLEILNPSAERVTPECEYYDKCGGCSLQHLEAQAQLKYKELHLINTLQRIGGVTSEIICASIDGPAWQYRRKARLATFYDKQQKRLIIGFREKQNSNIVPVTHCEVLAAPFNSNLGKISEIINELEMAQHVTHIEIIKADGCNAIVLRHVKPLTQSDSDRLADFAKAEAISVFLQGNASDEMLCLWPENKEYQLTIHTAGLSMRFSPPDFIQVNADINVKMIQRVLEFLDLNESDIVLDLFCGSGNFSLPIARHANKVIGVEGGQSMVKQADLNSKLNNINNAEFYCADLTKDLSEVKWLKESTVNKVILDPPRAGALEQMDMLGHLKCKKIVYVSCDPATLARDVGVLTAKYRYKLKQAGIMNMFPHTSHVESVVLLERK